MPEYSIKTCSEDDFRFFTFKSFLSLLNDAYRLDLESEEDVFYFNSTFLDTKTVIVPEENQHLIKGSISEIKVRLVDELKDLLENPDSINEGLMKLEIYLKKEANGSLLFAQSFPFITKKYSEKNN